MVFRANESADMGLQQALQYLIPRDADESERAKSRDCVYDLVDRYGPVVDAYPTWHPLVINHDPKCPVTAPNEMCGYKGVDHTILFRNGFVTCPYDGGKAILQSVKDLPRDWNDIASINAERLDTTLYHPSATPILVWCEWERHLLVDGTIPKAVAIPMILEREVPCWRWSELGETWETMRPYLLGTPCGSRSSLFVNQETGAAIRKFWRALIETGAFGPIKMSQF